jgi:hypothetical protein
MNDRATPTVVTLRMTVALRTALHDAASKAGCSLNSYALQVLAAAAGDPARFRGNATVAVVDESIDDLERDHGGYPLNHRERSRHNLARQRFIETFLREHPDGGDGAVIRRLDKEDPAFYVKWYEARSTEA